uniref:Centromere protein I n=1 Tax=Biomphalaria glabrata TaxID=6526 RepID=A0A2C9JF59_BIOGL
MASVLTRSMSLESSPQLEPESPSKRRSSALNNAMSFFLQLDANTVLRGNVKFHLSVDQIVKHAMNHGLTREQITTLIKIIVHPNTKISQAIRTKLVKCLVPSSKVPQSAVVRVISWISTRVFSDPGPTNLHSVLLRWILLIYDYIDGYDQLHKLYDIIFCFIHSYLLLPHACHLLFLLTRKHDVKLFKVQQLLQLTRKVGPESCIIGLLTIYKVFCPHLVPMKLEHSHKVYFKAHDSTWRSTIQEIVAANQAAGDDNGLDTDRAEIKIRKEKAFIQVKSKRQKLLVPEPHSASEEISEETDLNTTSLPSDFEHIHYAQLDSFSAYLEALDKIEYPSQIAAALKDKKLQLLLSCHPDQIVITRLCLWIQHVFAFGFRNTDKDECEKYEQLLQMLLSFSQNVQSFSVVEGFLECSLPLWDGQRFTPLIFSLITCFKPSTYNELHYCVLDPLHRLFFSCDVYFKSMCITALTKLLHNLSIINYGNMSSQEEQTQQEGNKSARDATGDMVLNETHLPSSTLDNTQSILLKLISFLDAVIVAGMMMEDDHYLLQMTTLDFLELVSSLFQKCHIPLVCLPLRVIHRLLLSDCPATLARLCEVINSFREAFTAVRSSRRDAVTCDTTLANQVSVLHPTGSKSKGVDKFNGLLLDIMGMLWQGRLFQERSNKLESIFHFKPPSHLADKIKDNALTIYMGPAFLGLAYKFLKETQREDKKIHPLQIEPFKDRYLLFLERENFPEFKKLVSTNIKSRIDKSAHL